MRQEIRREDRILSGEQSETIHQRLTRLRLAVKQGQEELVAAEAQLSQRQQEIRAIERRLRFRLGRSLDRLAELEEHIAQYEREIEQLRLPGAYEAGYLPVEEQYRRTWRRSSNDDIYAGAEPLNPADAQQIKRLYRRLARKYHPDLATDKTEQRYRTEKMAALNEAYAAGSLVELIALSGAGEADAGDDPQHANADLVRVLEQELARLQRKLALVNNEMENVHNNPVVQLSLDIKLAKRQGRDLLEEMSLDLERRIARAVDRRDELKARLDSLRR
ncbi:MAG: J domain-containing protein [Chloroflexota bacterium]|jgi:hypothetical protein